jgi:signal peptidase
LHAAFGYSGLVVVSQSMWPKYSTGSFLIAKEIDPYELKNGDVITYRSITSNEYITHRIIDIQSYNGQLFFVTQGDNNDTPDGNPVSEDRVVNKVLFGFNALGFMIQDAQDPVFLIEIVLLIILLWFIPVIIK